MVSVCPSLCALREPEHDKSAAEALVDAVHLCESCALHAAIRGRCAYWAVQEAAETVGYVQVHCVSCCQWRAEVRCLVLRWVLALVDSAVRLATVRWRSSAVVVRTRACGQVDGVLLGLAS